MVDGNFRVTLRHPRVSDADGMQSVLIRTWVNTYTPIMGAELAHESANRSFAISVVREKIELNPKVVLLADIDGEICGVAQVRSHGSSIHIGTLYINPDWQRTGIGTAMLERLAELHPYASSIALEVLQQNSAGINFYRSRNFRVLRQGPDSLKMGLQSLILQKDFEPKLIRPGSWPFSLILEGIRRSVARFN
jgi:ribosomal protein S18 acetylase RimI-like enzyme